MKKLVIATSAVFILIGSSYAVYENVRPLNGSDLGMSQEKFEDLKGELVTTKLKYMQYSDHTQDDADKYNDDMEDLVGEYVPEESQDYAEYILLWGDGGLRYGIDFTLIVK